MQREGKIRNNNKIDKTQQKKNLTTEERAFFAYRCIEQIHKVFNENYKCRLFVPYDIHNLLSKWFTNGNWKAAFSVPMCLCVSVCLRFHWFVYAICIRSRRSNELKRAFSGVSMRFSLQLDSSWCWKIAEKLCWFVNSVERKWQPTICESQLIDLYSEFLVIFQSTLMQFKFYFCIEGV